MKEWKQTEIGRIPREWEVVKFREVFSYIKGKKPAELIVEYKENYLPYLSTEYLRENKAAKYARISEDVISINKGDLILLWDGSNAGEFFIGKEGILSSTMVKLQLKKENIDLGFMFYLLKIKEYYLSGLTRGTGIPHVDKNVLENLTLPLPPLAEQKKIAKILSTMDEAIKKVDEAIAKTERLKKGLMQELLTKGIGHKEFKDTEIGRIPREWEVVRLKEVVDINNESRDPNREFPEREFLYIDIDSIENGTGVFKAAKTIVGREAPSRARRVIHYNDVIMSTVRPYLKAFAIVPKEYDAQICSTGFAVFTCKERILPFYLLYALFSNYVISQCNRMMEGGQYPALSSSKVEKIRLSLPSISEQKKITEILSTVDKRLELLKNKKERLERIKKGLMNDLLTGKKRVTI